MSDSGSGTALVEKMGETAAKRMGEKAVDRGLNAIADFVKRKFAERQVEIEKVFERYLKNATLRYNQIRTLATGTTPRTIKGDNSLYVSIGVDYNGEEIDTTTVDPLLQISKNILILGSGGVGKSMLTRYLFLDTAEYEGYVPVLVELRRIGTQVSGQLSILDLIYTCLQDFDAELPRDQFEYSLQLGKYLFLLDGFDEVRSSLAKETAEAIQAFSAKYPNNAFIVTSRPRTETSPMETFTIVKSMPLSKEQAVDLASRIWEEDEKTREFCDQLKGELYKKHKDFAENPLLLTMMFLTFMRNSSIPEHLSDFYKKAYEALYSAHDNQDKGYYRRDFACKTLDENEFKRILAHFCFQSYFKESYEFSEDEILKYLQASLSKLQFNDVLVTDYLTDLRNIVCMIVKDGDTYRFSHRSFQAYFAAYYTAHFLTDEQQKRLFSKVLSVDEGIYWLKVDYYDLLLQLELDRFVENALESRLRKLAEDVKTAQNKDILLFKRAYDGINIQRSLERKSGVENERVVYSVASACYDFNVLALFQRYLKYAFPDFNNANNENYSEDTQIVKEFVHRMLPPEERALRKPNELDGYNCVLSFDSIDSSSYISDGEREYLYKILIRGQWANGMYIWISKWIDVQDIKRTSLKSPSFIDEL